MDVGVGREIVLTFSNSPFPPSLSLPLSLSLSLSQISCVISFSLTSSPLPLCFHLFPISHLLKFSRFRLSTLPSHLLSLLSSQFPTNFPNAFCFSPTNSHFQYPPFPSFPITQLYPSIF